MNVEGVTGMASGTAGQGPLAGLRVLDLSRVLAGPFCALMLGDMGAEVVKVESPDGDDTRQWGPPWLQGCAPDGQWPGESAYYAACNRNKRGICLDLRTAAGQEVVRRLAAAADVVVENFKPGTMERWGLGYAALSQENPRLVYCNISGFGRTGPYAHLPGYDFVAQAMSGLMSITGEPPGEPQKLGVAIADLNTGMLAAYAILSALYGRQHSGRGQRVDASLLETGVFMLANVASAHLTTGQRPKRYGNAHASVVPYQVFNAADGALVIAVGNDRQFARVCEMLGCPELASDPRYATNPARLSNRDTLIPQLQQRFLAGKVSHWVDTCWAAGVPAGPINHVDQVFSDPQVLARGMVVEAEHPKAGPIKLVGTPVKLSETPAEVRRHPPMLGEHTREVLSELGYSPEQVQGLLAAGAARARDQG